MIYVQNVILHYTMHKHVSQYNHTSVRNVFTCPFKDILNQTFVSLDFESCKHGTFFCPAYVTHVGLDIVPSLLPLIPPGGKQNPIQKVVNSTIVGTCSVSM